MNDDQVHAHFGPLWDDVKELDQFYNAKPLLAHYTSISVLEDILEKEEIWLSNPLFMNDHEEVRFGIDHGVRAVMTSNSLSTALKSQARAVLFRRLLDQQLNTFANLQMLDTYVFCWSQHDPADNDGLLSMWRGYGSNGSGVALVIDTAKVSRVEPSPFVLARVRYATANERIAWVAGLVERFARLVGAIELSDAQLGIAAGELFGRIKMFALYSKHSGFKEEDEWRLAYLRDRDDTGQVTPMLDYNVGARGIEPKLKLRLDSAPGLSPAKGISISKIVDRIILGPTTSSPLAMSAVGRMVERIGKGDLRDRIRASTIPFRSRLQAGCWPSLAWSGLSRRINRLCELGDTRWEAYALRHEV